MSPICLLWEIEATYTINKASLCSCLTKPDPALNFLPQPSIVLRNLPLWLTLWATVSRRPSCNLMKAEFWKHCWTTEKAQFLRLFMKKEKALMRISPLTRVWWTGTKTLVNLWLFRVIAQRVATPSTRRTKLSGLSRKTERLHRRCSIWNPARQMTSKPSSKSIHSTMQKLNTTFRSLRAWTKAFFRHQPCFRRRTQWVRSMTCKVWWISLTIWRWRRWRLWIPTTFRSSILTPQP